MKALSQPRGGAPKRGELWRHFKGAVYTIVEVGIWCGADLFYEDSLQKALRNGDTIVTYRRVGTSRKTEPRSYTRALDEFMGEKPVNEDYKRYPQKYRFERVECDR